jgi:hypothetical protein
MVQCSHKHSHPHRSPSASAPSLCAVTQSAVTSLATTLAQEMHRLSVPAPAQKWLISWLLVLPVVLAAAPLLRLLAGRLVCRRKTRWLRSGASHACWSNCSGANDPSPINTPFKNP